MNFPDRFAAWYINLSVSEATAIAAFLFVLFCIVTLVIIDWCDPLKREMRQVRRARKHKRELIRDLQRANYRTERHCFREFTK